MKRRSRLLRASKWGGVAVCVMLIAVYVASGWWYFTGWSAERYYRSFGIGAGVVEVTWSNDRWVGPAMGSWGFSRHRAALIWTPAVTRRGPQPRAPMPTVTVRIPLWILLLITAIPTAFLWRLDRRPLRGHCPCGYDLTGNVSGTCPECGRQAVSVTDK